MISLAEAVPRDHYIPDNQKFKAMHNGKWVLVTAVLERTAVVAISDDDKILVNKALLFVPASFTLARVDSAKEAMRQRAKNGWRTNWQRRRGPSDD